MIIRDATSSDEGGWRRLWAGYLAFYETEIPSHVTDATWQRVLDPASSICGRVAERDTTVVGFAICVLHPGTWVTTPICYLEDLYVDQPARGRGVGHALIADLIQLGAERGWSRVYWHTRTDNTARKLYDRFVAADDYVRYRVSLQG